MPPLEHVLTLSDDVGIIQHASDNVPNRSTGYCTDDVARAFMVALQYQLLDPSESVAERLASTYLSFLQHAQRDDGRFHNFMSYERTWLDDVGTQDSNGRAAWALGFGMRYAADERWRTGCRRMFERYVTTIDDLTYPRSKAYTAIGLSHAVASGEGDTDAFARALDRLAADLLELYRANGDDAWEWFEDFMTYDNARLCEALLLGGMAMHRTPWIATGLRTFSFYTSVTIENGVYVPIGNEGWYFRGGPRARYAQQPLEAAALVDAAAAATEAGGDPAHRAAMLVGLEWFHGRNSRSVSLVRGGGCADGLEERGASENMGAESTLAYLSSACAVAARRKAPLRLAR